VSIDGPGRDQLRTLAQRLKDAGDEGKGLRRELMKQMDAAAQPLAVKIASVEHLKPYLPDRYAAVLAADLTVRAQKIFAGNPRVSIRAQGRAHKRKVALLDEGFINHPVFARGPRRTWDWKNRQTGGMRPGFFSEACRDAAPDIREHVLMAITETTAKVAHG
jgi:hypothetical protein